MSLSQRFVDAVAYAAEAHAGDVRKGSSVPYLTHPLAVAAIALEHGADEDEAIAALLHDVIEDHGPAHRQSIRERFGERVLSIVEACSDSAGNPKPPWKERKLAYLDRLRGASPSVLLVSAADKLHNLQSILRDYRSLGNELWGRFKTGKDGVFWYYRTVLDALGEAPPALRAELLIAFEGLEHLLREGKPRA